MPRESGAVGWAKAAVARSAKAGVPTICLISVLKPAWARAPIGALSPPYAARFRGR
jgi:hypothetical protein